MMTEPTTETLMVVSTAQLGEAGAKWLALGGPGATLYPNEYGGFMFVGYDTAPDFEDCVPAEVAHVAAWAWARSVAWVKFDPDGAMVPGL